MSYQRSFNTSKKHNMYVIVQVDATEEHCERAYFFKCNIARLSLCVCLWWMTRWQWADVKGWWIAGTSEVRDKQHKTSDCFCMQTNTQLNSYTYTRHQTHSVFEYQSVIALSNSQAVIELKINKKTYLSLAICLQ